MSSVDHSPLPPAASCWISAVQKKPVVPDLSSRIFADGKSSKGISVAVVDASAIIHGDQLAGCADKFVSVREVLEEVRDPVSRQRLAFLPFPVETLEPSSEAVRKVVSFARETGDLQTLSDVDLKLIALTYMLESQIHGTSHLKKKPPALHVVNVKHLPDAQMPGWGNNVPNLPEWEALEQIADEGMEESESRILPVKNLDNNVVPASESADDHIKEKESDLPNFQPQKFNYPKREIKIEGKKMVASGVDASMGEDSHGADDWHPAVSRSTHRRYLIRKARREARLALGENEQLVQENHKPEERNVDGNVICSVFKEMRVDEDHADIGHNIQSNEHMSDVTCIDQEEESNDICERHSDMGEVLSQADMSIDKSFSDDASSEQSWMLRSLSDSTIACITSDYAMQNVILQIGLRLLAPGGMQIRQLHRWVLKCHACNKVTPEVGKIFCPKCGNGGTLRKVSVTVGENGILLAARRQRIILRGTKFSLPLPQGGRDAITKDLILREDQLPRKLLYPKTKKKSNEQNDDFLCSDNIFSHGGDKRAPLKPPVRKAIAVFSGKRNPNDNHFSRKH
ncbi:hypothetical protein AXF42_Ash020490 [Apostasia shenzhenica]|uniref:RNA-binding protein NOB1 n=1 Tax=Apostasia shenzhenica TaxID=1088818 RepID=A0A2H9ZZD2_9ASPA|nr:hypothetical protein AXF42_Ash020490 [Apostasia shenzhenica]